MTKKGCCENMSQQTLQTVTVALVIVVVAAAYLIGFNMGKMSEGGSIMSDGGNVEVLKGVAGKGSEDAPVLIEEWSDFECPFCARFYQQTLPQIEEQYIKTGKVKLVYKDFPLSFHATAQKAAEGGKCALEQGKFWELHDKIFDSAGAGQKPTVDNLKAWAGELGMNTGKFNECLDSGRMATKVQADMQEGQQKGVRGTPGFLINGELISGAQPFENFKAIIDKKLAE
ncbi:DsbA family protein [Candidatus Woesearchaeota archaeon]|nr:DsbA family protein [Candidatus Woesearchaeota archaeon]